MPTERQISAQLKKEETELKRDIISRVSSAAINVFHESYLYESRIWPTDGFKMGNGLSENKKECIFVGVNAYGYNQSPVVGTLHMWPTTSNVSRKKSQYKHIRFLLDYTVYDDISFEDIFRNSGGMDSHLWFTFKVNE
jgi:hypothetical protein